MASYYLSCKDNGNKQDPSSVVSNFNGCEMEVGCKAGVQEKLYVSVLSAKNQEHFGIISASNLLN